MLYYSQEVIEVKSYLNLTNGIEYLGDIKADGFIRIQSTACEQKRWDFIIQELDYSFLMDLALGEIVMVHDMGANKETSRAIYQGLEFVKFALNKNWLGKDYIPKVRGFNCYKYFIEVYNNLDKRTLKKLDYFKKFLKTDCIWLLGHSKATIHDGDYTYYNDKLEQYYKG